MRRRLSEVEGIAIKGFDGSEKWDGHNTFSGTITYTDGMLQTFSIKQVSGKDFYSDLARAIKSTMEE